MDTTELVKEKTDIVKFIGRYVTLSPAGKNLKGLCPFHKEKTPSFVVSPERNTWHCFGCSKGSDVIGFLMEYENIDFIEALRILAQEAGVEMQLRSSQDQRSLDKLYEINQLSAKYFQAALWSEQGKESLEYLKKRGLSETTLKEFGVGLAGPARDGLLKFLNKKGYSMPDLEKAGVVYKNEKGMRWDRFRDRIMVPFHNHCAKVVGFTGRLLATETRKDVGKYINTADSSPIFHKSRLLYGFFKSKDAIRESSEAVLVEGQMDFLAAYQDGIKNAVATSGTALTSEHLKALRKRAEKIILAFDGDEAGKAAAERGIALAQQEDFAVRVLILDDKAGKDPADIVQNSPGRLAELLKQAASAMDYYFAYYRLDKPMDIQEKKKALRAMLSKIRQIQSPVERSHYLSELARKVGMPEQVLKEEMDQLSGPMVQEQAPSSQSSALPQSNFSAADLISQRILSLALNHDRARQELKEAKQFFPPVYREIYEIQCGEKKGKASQEQEQLMNFIQLRSSINPVSSEEVVHEVKELTTRLREYWKKSELIRVRGHIEQAESRSDQKALEEALKAYKELSS
ncbi:MAG: DNA primase [Candidatus Harrisonbacteria bacterium]|nr:DNA primase [Candidatus Harrisonbacteria bacterium]